METGEVKKSKEQKGAKQFLFAQCAIRSKYLFKYKYTQLISFNSTKDVKSANHGSPAE